MNIHELNALTSYKLANSDEFDEFVEAHWGTPIKPENNKMTVHRRNDPVHHI
jgi:hypothetical protein